MACEGCGDQVRIWSAAGQVHVKQVHRSNEMCWGSDESCLNLKGHIDATVGVLDRVGAVVPRSDESGATVGERIPGSGEDE